MSPFNVDYYISELKLSTPFTISRGTKETVRNVVVELTSDGITGYGEAAPNRRYDEDAMERTLEADAGNILHHRAGPY